MQFFGKIFGAFFGYLTFGYLGAFIGALLGHFFDRGLSTHLYDVGDDSKAAQVSFFIATFQLMGYLAKLDGRVSEEEIQSATWVMGSLGLSASQRQEAILLFTQGKDEQFSVELAIDSFLANCAGRRALLQVFMEIQLQAAFDASGLNPHKYAFLKSLSLKLGFDERFIDGLVNRFEAEQAYEQEQQSYQHQQNGQYQQHSYSSVDELKIAYGILGVSKDATDKEVKMAYRKLMSEHHPDKLIAKGLPEHMVKVATEKTQKIQAAFEKIEKHRKM